MNKSLGSSNDLPFQMTNTSFCLCENEDSENIATGEDFEYRTSPDTFIAKQCLKCSLVYLSPRPVFEEFERIYPASYHAFVFSERECGFVFNVRRKLEAKRLLSWCKGLRKEARIIDIGCGDGFYLELLKDFGNKNWTLEGVG
ncbi:MAG: hypothetical protein KDB79_10450 [Acidobacteria bacterium]|nr:hypothetical protein [Acidobacteriota bacterium]